MHRWLSIVLVFERPTNGFAIHRHMREHFCLLLALHAARWSSGLLVHRMCFEQDACYRCHDLLVITVSLGIRRFFAGVGHITVDEVEQVIETIQESKKALTLHDLSEKTHLSRSNLAEALNRLEDIEVIETLPGGEIAASDKEYDVDKVGQEVLHAHESRRQYEKSRIEMMRGYAEVQDCRRKYLLNYLGEETAGPCGHYDNCDNGIIVQDQIGQEPFPINSHVKHKIWGAGHVLRYEADKMVVLFDEVGYKTLSVDLVIANHILEPCDS